MQVIIRSYSYHQLEHLVYWANYNLITLYIELLCPGKNPKVR